MNELQLSNSLPIIETEIRQYQNLAGESIFEIGRRLKHVKENDLVHGEFGKWLETLNMNHNVANKMMKIASTESLNYATSHNLGMQALYEIATLPELERTKEHVTSKGETKTPDEMTVRELRELKKQLKQQEQQNATLQQQLERVENKEPKTVVKEVVPAHLKAQLSDKENELIENRRRTALLEKELNDMKSQSERKTDKSQEKLSYDDEIGSRRFKAESSVLDLRDEINEFLKRNSINAFREGAIATSSQRTKDSLLEGIEELELFCKTMRSSLDGRLIIN